MVDPQLQMKPTGCQLCWGQAAYCPCMAKPAPPIRPAPIITVPNWPVTSVRHSKDLYIDQVQINVSRRSQLSHCYWTGDWT